MVELVALDVEIGGAVIGERAEDVAVRDAFQGDELQPGCVTGLGKCGQTAPAIALQLDLVAQPAAGKVLPGPQDRVDRQHGRRTNGAEITVSHHVSPSGGGPPVARKKT